MQSIPPKNLKTKVANLKLIRYNLSALAETMAYLGLAIAVPFIFAHTPQNQWITGTLVNTILIIACVRTGLINAAFIAAVPSVIALLRGLLPLPMAAALPYIIISNILMIMIFSRLFQRNRVFAVISASFAKFLFLFSISSLLIADKLPQKFAYMLSLPQLITALAGGLLAMLLLNIWKKQSPAQ
ncbi:MAG: ECF transporter S component [Candidatus Moranbacteria bacterium]|nr:ECF transporter S component [Candidatus Moranbacteria bacterium]